MPPVLVKAARIQLGLSHLALGAAAKVSKKTINDYENEFLVPRTELALRLRHALEANGARFLYDPERMVVMTATPRQALPERSRSPRLNRDAKMSEPKAGGRPRGRTPKSMES